MIFVFRPFWAAIGYFLLIATVIFHSLIPLFMAYALITGIGMIFDLHREQRAEAKKEAAEKARQADRYSDKKGSYHRHAEKKASL